MNVVARYRELFVAIVAVTGTVLALLGVGPTEWPGEVSGCLENDDCYCETFQQTGFAVQPANTISNLGFVAVGLAVLVGVGLRRGSTSRNGESLPLPPLDRGRGTKGEGGLGTARTALFGYVAIGLGIGSALFHGTMRAWGGWADLVSMYAFVGLVLTYNLSRLYGWGDRRFFGAYGAIVGSLALIQLPLEEGLGKWVFGVLIGATLVTEYIIADRGKFRRDRKWLWRGLAIFLVAYIVWNLSRTGAALCAPDSAWQGHALWHLATAGSVGAIYLYLQSERRLSVVGNQ